MDEQNAAQFAVRNSDYKQTLLIIVALGMANIGTDFTVGLVPGVGDVANSLLDTIFTILQIGALMYLKYNGIEQIPNRN